MFKPSYIVVSSVLVALAILAFARQLLVGLIPPAASNRLEGSHQTFLAVAGHFPINWHTVEDDGFRLARASDKPILLVVGIFGNRISRDMDKAMFEDPDTAQYVSQNFYCIRIDGYEHPEWLNSILPISRMRMKLYPGFQSWVLDSSGHVLSFIGHWQNSPTIDNQEIYNELVQSHRRYDELRQGGTGLQTGVDQQRVDLDLLGSQSGSAVPSFTAYTASLTDQSDPRNGGFPQDKIQSLFPNTWRFLSLTGNTKLLKATLDPVLFSPLMDLQDGGFFRLSNTLDFSRIEFAKPSRTNAEMMLTLAIEGRIEGDQFYEQIASSTFDWLYNETIQNSMIPACQEDDENAQGRSPRLSFPSWTLRDFLNDKDRDWASDQLNLDPRTNNQMVPFLRSKTILLDPEKRYTRILGQLKTSAHLQPRFSDPGYLDVNGHTLARMLEVARIWGAPERILRLGPTIEKLSQFKTGDDLIHRIDNLNGPSGYLGDYLAYSDVMLQMYLTTGRLDCFQEGLRVLSRAITVFKGDRMGQFNLSASAERMGGMDTLCVPQVADDLGESCSAQAIRLLLAYGRLLGDTRSGRDLLQLAQESTYLFAELAAAGGPEAGGYFCSAAEVADDQYAVAVGPRALDLASILVHRIPTRFIAPALGGIRRDLQQRKPGIYLVGKTIEGPFTVEEAAQRLPTSLVGRRIGDTSAKDAP